MSPLNVRRYRAERLLRSQFDGLRGRVLASVRGRLRASGVTLDGRDLEACYAQAWHGLYAVVLDGQEVHNPTGWLVLATFRRAIEEQRSRLRTVGVAAPEGAAAGELERAQEREPADTVADAATLRQLFEGMRGRLDARELQAATLCYLHGLSRAEAAERMGISPARMRKLMEGSRPGRPGVSGKVGALVASIREGRWCEEQGSLMRGLAYGMLDPDGERYRLAMMHRDGCPACRAYVRSLRGLAAALPPVMLPWAALAPGGSATAAGAGTAAGAQAAPAGSGVASLSGAAGAGASSGAGGGWLLAGSSKLAIGCLLAAGVGAGCVALSIHALHGPVAPRRARSHALSRPRRTAAPLLPVAAGPGPELRGGSIGRAPHGAASVAYASAVGRALREFGPERSPAPAGPRALPSGHAAAGPAEIAARSSAAAAGEGAGAPSISGSPAGEAAAQHEFGPG